MSRAGDYGRERWRRYPRDETRRRNRGSIILPSSVSHGIPAGYDGRVEKERGTHKQTRDQKSQETE